MYLKRLELHGFKTFADHTELEFNPGMTAIVGPNGSGKSNVFDGIRWALGEMSFRSLRSGRMDDVIFAGSEAKREMGLAEVSLTINNDSGILPVEFTEVTVTRRANRGGEGECFLNHTSCRLRDLQMLFLGTGLGGRSYSLVSQGQVDSVLNAGPEVRRIWLEEAAGLARYKRRRREAERRLTHAATHVLRVQDVFAELVAQLELLHEQAKAAAAYQAYTREIRDLELALQVDEARRILAHLKRISTQAESVQEQLHAIATGAAEVGRQIDRDRARAGEAARAWEDAQRTLLQVVEDVSSRGSAMQILQERVRATAAQHERIAGEVQGAEARLVQMDEILASLRGQAETLARQRDSLLHQLRVAEEGQANALQTQQGTEERLAIARAEITDLVASRTRTHHDLAQVTARLATASEQLGALEVKEAALMAAAEQLQAATAEIETHMAELRRVQEEAHGRLLAAQGKRRDIEAAFHAVDDEIRRLEADRQGVASTLALLENMDKHLAGYDQGVREILLAKREHPARFAGIRYPVVELLRVAPAHRMAIEAALGRRLFSLVASTVDDVKAGLTYLRGNRGGSATFLPVELIAPRPTPSIPTGGAIVGRGADLVDLSNGAREVTEALLGDVLVVTSLDAAVELRRSGYTGRIATLDGELLSQDGVISVRGNGDSMLLGRREQIETLRTRLAGLEASRAGLEARRAEHTLELAELDAAMVDAEAAGQRCDEAIAKQQVALSLMQAEGARLSAERVEQQSSRDQAAARRAKMDADASRVRDDEAVISRAIAEGEESIAAIEVSLQSAVTRAQTATGELVELRVKIAELAGTLEALEARIDEHVHGRAELAARCDQVRGEIAVLNGEQHLLEHSLREARGAHQGLVELQDTTRSEIAALEAERTGLQETLVDLEAQWRQAQASLREVEEQAHRLEVRHAQADTELTSAQRRLSEEFGVNWEGVRDVRLPVGRDEALGRIEALRGLLAALGPVNLRSVQEHQAVAARVDALRSQLDDLERARQALTALIQRLDRVLRVRFNETFEAVNEEFNRLLIRLFTGGRGRLVLVDGEPGTEPGIEIEAQLPGKKMRSLSAYSGGERVLVALALIFAMLRVHPSPFCIFDEVDAALDDVNTRRFTTLLRELAERTQVLIITHNKGTMEVADVLYGVTMEIPGVSKIISMRLTPKDASEPAAPVS